ncbi:MAG: alpha/beta fold hydrolase [Pseudomonadota bacterium]
MLHGIGMSRHSWDGQIWELRSNFRGISYDLRGQALSSRPKPAYKLNELADDFAAALRS